MHQQFLVISCSLGIPSLVLSTVGRSAARQGWRSTRLRLPHRSTRSQCSGHVLVVEHSIGEESLCQRHELVPCLHEWGAFGGAYNFTYMAAQASSLCCGVTVASLAATTAEFMPCVRAWSKSMTEAQCERYDSGASCLLAYYFFVPMHLKCTTCSFHNIMIIFFLARAWVIVQ
jgi:hypothetical protein